MIRSIVDDSLTCKPRCIVSTRTAGRPVPSPTSSTYEYGNTATQHQLATGVNPPEAVGTAPVTQTPRRLSPLITVPTTARSDSSPHLTVGVISTTIFSSLSSLRGTRAIRWLTSWILLPAGHPAHVLRRGLDPLISQRRQRAFLACAWGQKASPMSVSPGARFDTARRGIAA